MKLARPTIRLIFYTLLATALAAWVMFEDLGADRIEGDEAIYARCVDNMVANGEWLSPGPFPGARYFQKPPLQMWLSAITYNAFPDIARYRVWSAFFGAAAVALTCVLGGRLFWPEIGLIAGLLLATNNRFLYEHGARSGAFDAALTFFLLAAAAVFCLILNGDARRFGWVAIGVYLGLAGLLKPLAGFPIVPLLTVLIFLQPRARWKPLLIGLAVAVGVSLLVLAPWYVAQTARWGHVFLDDIVRRNLVDRTTVGLDPRHLKPLTFYLLAVHKSSWTFALAWPAIGFAAIACFVGRHRAAWRFIVLLGVGWIALFSLSPSKSTHYIYPALPAISICIAGLIAWIIHSLARGFADAERRERAVVIGYVLPIVLLMVLAGQMSSSRGSRVKVYEPFVIYQALEPAIRAGQVRFLIAGVHEPQPLLTGGRGLEPGDLFYLQRMPGWQQLDPPAIDAALKENKPTLLWVSSTGPGLDLSPFSQRLDERFNYDSLAFSMRLLDAGRLLQPVVSADRERFENRLKLSAKPAVNGPAIVELRFKLNAPPKSAVLISSTVKGRPLVRTLAFINGADGRAAIPLTSRQNTVGGVEIDIALQSVEGDEPLAGQFINATMQITPRAAR